MNLIQNIATQIEARVEQQAKDQLDRTGRKMGLKVKTQMALEQWIGAVEGITALEGDQGKNAQWVLRVLTMIIWPRDYEETQRLAREGREVKEKAA